MVWGISAEQRWERNIALLKAFREREGDCEVSARHEEEGVTLGDWLVKQRVAHKNGTLDAARQTQLEALGVVWGISAEQRWERNFALLKTFSEREGGCKVPERHEEEGVKLGSWLCNLRKAHKNGTLGAAQRTQLEALGAVWSSKTMPLVAAPATSDRDSGGVIASSPPS